MKNLRDTLRDAYRHQAEIERDVKKGLFEATEETRRKADSVLAEVTSDMAAEISKSGGITDEIQNKMNEAIKERAESLGTSYEEIQQIQNMAISATGMGPIGELMEDKDVTEIIVQRYDHIIYEKKGVVQRYEGQFNSEEHLQTIINKMIQPMGKSINIANPIVDAAWEDGSRINATIPPVSPKGATMSIRKFSDKAFTGQDYLNFGSIDKRGLRFLEACVEGKLSIIISGGTGTGKTTFINMLSNAIPKNELIVTVEDTPELKLESPNVRTLVTRESKNSEMMNIDIAACIKNALRMRPDRIIVGEIRDGAIVDMLSAMSTGHEGSMSTVHANSPQNLCNSRLPILYGKNPDMKVPVEVQNIQFAEAVHLIVQLKRYAKGTDKIKKGSRKVVNITAVEGIDANGRVKLQDIYRFDEKNNRFYATGYYPAQIMELLETAGIVFDDEMFPTNEADYKESPEEILADGVDSSIEGLMGNVADEMKANAEQKTQAVPTAQSRPPQQDRQPNQQNIRYRQDDRYRQNGTPNPFANTGNNPNGNKVHKSPVMYEEDV